MANHISTPLSHQLFPNFSHIGEEGRLIHHLNGTIEVIPKPPAYVVGERILRPMIDAGVSCCRKLASAVVLGCSSIDAALTSIFRILPTASAETVPQKTLQLPNLTCSPLISSSYLDNGQWQADTNTEGDVIAVLQGSPYAGSYVVVDTLSAQSGAWVPPVQLSYVGDSITLGVAISGGGNGSALVAWNSLDAKGFQTSTFSETSWTSPANITAWLGENYIVPLLASYGKNSVAMFTVPPSPIIQISNFENGQWSLPIDAGTAAQSSQALRVIALDPNGNGVALWASDPATVQAIHRFFGQSWTSPTTILTFQALPVQNPALTGDLVVSEKGDALAVAANRQTTPGFNSTIQVAILPFKSVWSPPSILYSCAPSECGAFLSAGGAMDAQGNGIVVWNINNRLQASIRPFNGVWSSPITIFDKGEFGQLTWTSVDVDNKGNALLAWAFQYGSYNLMNAICSLVSGQCTQPMNPGMYIGTSLILGPSVKVSKHGVATFFWSANEGSGGYNMTAMRCRMPMA